MGSAALIISLNIVAFFALFLYVRRRVERVLSADEIVNKVRDEVQHLIVELNQTTDRNLGLIEERIEKLQKLMQDADRKIVTLNREYEKHEVGARLYNHLRRSAPELKLPREPADSSPRPEGPTEPHGKPDTAAEVLELYHQGFDSRIIASKLGTTLGEVELIISLDESKR